MDIKVLKSFVSAHDAVNWVSQNRIEDTSIETTGTLKSVGMGPVPSGNYHVVLKAGRVSNAIEDVQSYDPSTRVFAKADAKDVLRSISYNDLVEVITKSVMDVLKGENELKPVDGSKNSREKLPPLQPGDPLHFLGHTAGMRTDGGNVDSDTLYNYLIDEVGVHPDHVDSDEIREKYSDLFGMFN